MMFLLAGGALILTGGLVSVGFWIPALIDRPRLRAMLGPRYPLVYLVYSANGPLLLVSGVLLVLRYFAFF
jgi:hypothetical protein